LIFHVHVQGGPNKMEQLLSTVLVFEMPQPIRDKSVFEYSYSHANWFRRFANMGNQAAENTF